MVVVIVGDIGKNNKRPVNWSLVLFTCQNTAPKGIRSRRCTQIGTLIVTLKVDRILATSMFMECTRGVSERSLKRPSNHKNKHNNAHIANMKITPNK